MNKGHFIVVEGLEGAGKSTAIAVVKDWLLSRSIPENNIVLTREPGGTKIAEKIRELVKFKDQEESLDGMSELLLMIASRVQLVKQVIQPALSRGAWVISDRFELSTRAYQGGGRGISLNSLKKLHEICVDNFQPDLTLYLDIPPVVGFERIQARGYKDRIEQEDLAFFERVRKAYQECVLNSNNTIIEINAFQSIEQVHQDIIDCLERHF